MDKRVDSVQEDAQTITITRGLSCIIDGAYELVFDSKCKWSVKRATGVVPIGDDGTCAARFAGLCSCGESSLSVFESHYWTR